MTPPWAFDRHLRYEELAAWLRATAAAHPDLVTLESYGRSHEGRELLLVTVTDAATGPAASKPAHWVDAAIHAVELTATVAACHLIQHLVDGYRGDDERVRRALASRTFYVVPRVNPDGAEMALADSPRYLRSSTRPWPRTDPRPGLVLGDVDGDGRVLQMRMPDPNGGWYAHPDDERLMVPVPPQSVPANVARYRLLIEGTILDHDGWTIPTPRDVAGLDLNRNFPVDWSPSVTGAGDHPLSEPEVDAMVRAMVARPNICGTHAYHTAGGVFLRPSSFKPDSDLPADDVWTWSELGANATAHTGYPVHSIYEDFTWDRSNTLSGAADDWAYEHQGVFSWTTEFWDVVLAATGEKQSTRFWYTGPTDEQALAVLRWVDEHHPSGFVDWYPFEHPQLGPVEIGGWDELHVWVNPPPPRLAAEIAGHADVVIDQALAAPELDIAFLTSTLLAEPDSDGRATWNLQVGVANTGWLATDISAHARKAKLVLPGTVTVTGTGLEVLDGPARVEFGQLEGRAALRFRDGNDGTPDRALIRYLVRAAPGTDVLVSGSHPRAGQVRRTLTL